MKLLWRWLTGDVALWCAFWLVGLPLVLVWDSSGACMVFGCGIENLSVAGSVIALFALSSIAVVLASVAIWRSATKYPRETWRQTCFAVAAKLCAVFSGLAAALSLLAGSYLLSDFVRAIFVG